MLTMDSKRAQSIIIKGGVGGAPPPGGGGHAPPQRWRSRARRAARRVCASDSDLDGDCTARLIFSRLCGGCVEVLKMPSSGPAGPERDPEVWARAARLGFGRIVGSGTEAPSTFANPVQSGWAAATQRQRGRAPPAPRWRGTSRAGCRGPRPAPARPPAAPRRPPLRAAHTTRLKFSGPPSHKRLASSIQSARNGVRLSPNASHVITHAYQSEARCIGTWCAAVTGEDPGGGVVVRPVQRRLPRRR